MPTQYGLVTGRRLNMREQAGALSTRLIQIPNNTTIAVADYNDDWYITTYGTYTGYVLKQYVTSLNAISDTIHQGSVTGGGLNLYNGPPVKTISEKFIVNKFTSQPILFSKP